MGLVPSIVVLSAAEVKKGMIGCSTVPGFHVTPESKELNMAAYSTPSAAPIIAYTAPPVGLEGPMKGPTLGPIARLCRPWTICAPGKAAAWKLPPPSFE